MSLWSNSIGSITGVADAIVNASKRQRVNAPQDG